MTDFARLARVLGVRRQTWRLRVEMWARQYEAATKEALGLTATPPSQASALAVWAFAEPARQRRRTEIEARRDRAMRGMAAAALQLRRAAAAVRVAERAAMAQANQLAMEAHRRYAADLEAWQTARAHWLRRGRRP